MKKLINLLVMALICMSCEHKVMQSDMVQGIGVFSVSETQKVTFSPGNLQYHRATSSWHFAQSQAELLSINNLNSPIRFPNNGNYISALRLDSMDIDPQLQLGSKIDLFGWGTGDNPTQVSQNAEDYTDFVDWGRHVIDNDHSMAWRTLNYEEWDYLLHKRLNADSLWAFAEVKGCPGKIFLPDGWVCPRAVSFQAVHGNVPVMNLRVNCYYEEDWAVMEKSGAVFLPYSCARNGVSIMPFISVAGYWVASYTDDTHGVAVGYFSDEELKEVSRCLGYNVRLVKDIKH